MKKQTLYSVVVLSALVLVASGASFNALAQDTQRKFKPGEMVELGGGQSVKIFQCRGRAGTKNAKFNF